MRIIHKPRQSGKTTEIINIAAENNSCIVCQNKRQCEQINKLAKDMNLIIPSPITIDDFISKRYHGQEINSFVIDNMETIVYKFAGEIPVIAMSVTANE